MFDLESKSEKTPITCDCQVDNNVLKELEDAEGQAIQTVKVMNDLKDRLGVLCQVTPGYLVSSKAPTKLF